MRVVHVIPHEGAAYRLHLGLRRAGCESQMMVLESRTDDPHVVAFRPPMDPGSRIRRTVGNRRIRRSFDRYAGSRPVGVGYFFDDRCAHGGDMVKQLPPCDIIHLHTMFRLVDFRAFFASAPRRAPVVRTLHDMTFFTGGCHHDWGCGRFTARCGACPQLGSRTETDLSREIWRRKEQSLAAVPPDRLHFVAPSRWLADTAKRSSLLSRYPIEVIPLGLDTELFSPRNRQMARRLLDVPVDRYVVLFIADPIARPEKGFALLAKALARPELHSGVVLLSVGRGDPPCPVPIPHIRLGYIGSERLLPMVFSAADVCAVPSVQDNFPYAALEALACGTPVVGFGVGGLPEIVRPGSTGHLAPAGDVAELGRLIGLLRTSGEQRAWMGRCCREVALAEYRLDLQAQRHLQLYERILEAARVEATRDGAGRRRGHLAHEPVR